MRTTPPLLVAVLAATLVAPTACGDAVPGASPEAAELARDPLTIEDVRRFARARTALAELATQDSTVWAVLRPLSRQADAYASVQDAAKALELHPGIRETLGATGVDPEAYVRTRFALQQALLAHDIRREGGESAPIPASIPEENVQLVAEHRSEIEHLLADPVAEPAAADTADGG